jgi:nucleotide-binding universal stress UspA family protein
MKVLVGVDFSRSSDAAVREVADRPWPEATLVRLVAVVEPLDFAANRVFVERYVKTKTEGADGRIRDIAEALRERGLTVSTILAPGSPRTEIAAEAKRWKADLVIVGSRGRGALRRTLLGSVAQAVVRRAPCSVEVVRPPARGRGGRAGMAILLATDGSEASLEAARSVAGRPWPSGTRVRVVSVARSTPSPADSWTIPSAMLKGFDEQARQAAKKAAASAAHILESAGLAVSEAVLQGDPRKCLVDESRADPTDLLVVGSHGRHGFDRLLPGSVSEFVAIHAPCSVEVVRAA